MPKSILNKLRPGVLSKKERGKSLWEAGTIFKILLAMERSWTPAKSKKCSELELHFEKPGLVKGKLPDRLTLPCADLDSLVMELPGVLTLAFRASSHHNCPFSCLKLARGMAAFRAHKNGIIAMPALSVLSPTWSIAGELRWPSSGPSTLTGQRWQTLRWTLILLSIPGADKLQGMRTVSDLRQTLFDCPEIPESLLAESVSAGEHWLPGTGALRMRPFPRNVGENIPALFHAKTVRAIWNFQKEKLEKNERIISYHFVLRQCYCQ